MVAERVGGRKIDSQRVYALRTALGMSQGKLAELVGYDSYQSIQSIESGRSKRPTRLRELAKALQTSEGYLLGETDIPTSANRVLYSLRDAAGVPKDSIPQIDTHGLAVAGVAKEVPPFRRKDVLAYWTLPPRLLEARQLICVEVEGDWMSPTFDRGDFVFVDLKDRDPPGVFLITGPGGTVLIQRLEPAPEFGGLRKIRLSSDNPRFRPRVEKAEDVHIIGRCILRLSHVSSQVSGRPRQKPGWFT